MLHMSTAIYHPMALFTELQRKCECLFLCLALIHSPGSSMHFFSSIFPISITLNLGRPLRCFPDCGITVPQWLQKSKTASFWLLLMSDYMLISWNPPSPIQWWTPTPAPLSFCLLCRDIKGPFMLLWSELLCRTRSENENTVSLVLSKKQANLLHSGVQLLTKRKLHLYVYCTASSSYLLLNWPFLDFLMFSQKKQKTKVSIIFGLSSARKSSMRCWL